MSSLIDSDIEIEFPMLLVMVGKFLAPVKSLSEGPGSSASPL